MMRLVGALLVGALLAAAIAGSVASAQTPPPVPSSTFSPPPFVDKGAEKSRIQQQEHNKKWAGCKKQARAQKVKLRNWNKFMNDCMAS